MIDVSTFWVRKDQSQKRTSTDLEFKTNKHIAKKGQKEGRKGRKKQEIKNTQRKKEERQKYWGGKE